MGLQLRLEQMEPPIQQERQEAAAIEVDEEVEPQEEEEIHALEDVKVVHEVGRNKGREEVDLADHNKRTGHHYPYHRHKMEEDQMIRSKKYRGPRSRLARKKTQTWSSASSAPHRSFTAHYRLVITVLVTFAP